MQFLPCARPLPCVFLTGFALVIALAPSAFAGVSNPDISVIGQPSVRYTDEVGSPDRKRGTIDVGETELVLDAPLNPYARGTVVAALATDGAEVEEAFFVLNRGLPAQFALKGGKYRAGFGRLNAAHPHTYPFAERFHVLAAYLPGEESLNETGLSLSRRLALGDAIAIEAAADWLAGASFRATEENDEGYAADPRRDESRPSFLGRLSGFRMLGERSAVEFGASAIRGTNNVSAATRTTVLGADLKAKLWNSPRSYLLLQAEGLGLRREEAARDSLRGGPGTATRAGGYIFVDYNFATRYNAGASFEAYEQGDDAGESAHAFGLFAGFALMEETTAFRLDWNRFSPPESAAINALTLRIIYSMGPHKAHQF